MSPATSSAIAFALLAALAAPSGTASAQSYAITTFDYPGSKSTQPAGINDRDQVVGTATLVTPAAEPDLPPSVETFGFLYRDGTFSRIDYPYARGTYLTAINDRGDIAGTADFSNTDGPSISFVYRDGAFTPIQVPGALLTEVLGINNRGDMVGYYWDSNEQSHAFVYRHGTFEAFAVPGTDSTLPRGINDRDEIVGGYSTSNSGPSIAFLDDAGAFTTIAAPGPADAGAFGSAINNRGQIVGTIAYGGYFGIVSTVGFVETKGVVETVIVPGSQFDTPYGPRVLTSITGINDHGVITGSWYQNDISAMHGFIGIPVAGNE